MAYAVVRTDKMFGTDNRAGLASVMYMGSGTTETAIENGNVVVIDGLKSGEREIYKGVTPAANSDLKDVLLIASPEVMYNQYDHNLVDFRNEAGDICRGYYLHKNDIFSVTADAINNAKTDAADLAVGDVIELYAGTKLQAVASLTQGSTKVGEVIAIELADKLTYYVIQVG